MKNHKKGFTLLEVLLAVAFIGILAGIIVIVLNPSKQLSETRNAQRRADINTVLNAIYQYSIDNNGELPPVIDSATNSSQVLGTAGSGLEVTCTATETLSQAVDLKNFLVPTYLTGIPYDPVSGDVVNTDYYINKDANGRLVVGVCDPELSMVMSVTR